MKLLKWFITDDSQGNSQQHLQYRCLSILERHAASRLKELRGCLVLKKTHDKNILEPIGSASANKHRISYIYSTAGKMLKLELHQQVKWLHHTQSLKMIHLTIFLPCRCWYCQKYCRF